ncbi:hypothetical protein EJ03DRAFT_274785 [Teratosphaeria nubilosa]|uniref:HIT-type domain-containing protein n=1 Tax=Teratosphaeria nubilosa TaxID=161662 RepID=A0A6G1L6D7_9PEZI|nr:hypothetical protein EJ03DRAFT_274785 [Teratosphaeria nubilosa]
MTSTAPVCGVCQTNDSKYKCPICVLRYCSLDCYRSHKTQHADDEVSRTQQEARAKQDRPGTTQRVPKISFTGLGDDAEFQRLLKRYPLLKTQLGAIYGLTLEPGPDEHRSWNRQPLFADPSSRGHPFRGGRGRGGIRGRAMKGMGTPKRGPYQVNVEDRPRGPWTEEKGEKEALGLVKSMRKGSEDDERAEGMREFIALCALRFGPEGQGGGMGDVG